MNKKKDFLWKKAEFCLKEVNGKDRQIIKPEKLLAKSVWSNEDNFCGEIQQEKTEDNLPHS